MEISFTLEPNDAVQLTTFWLLRSKAWFFVLLFIVIFPFLSTGSHDRATILLSIGIPLLLVPIGGAAILPSIIRSQAKSQIGFADTRIIRISTVLFEQIMPLYESKVEWRGIRDIREGKNAIYFFLSNKQAFILPKRVFPSNEAAQGFYQAAVSYWNAGKRSGEVDGE